MVEMASQVLGVTLQDGAVIPRARRSTVDPNEALVEAIHAAYDDDRLGSYELLTDDEQARLLRLSAGVCGAVIEMGANPEEAASVAVDTLCASAAIIPRRGSYGQ